MVHFIWLDRRIPVFLFVEKVVFILDFLDGVEFNAIQFVGPIIVLIITMVCIALIYKSLFAWLPKKLYNALIGPAALFGAYIWAIPMNLGFYTYFQ